ncbi:metal-dependent phosphohydrolase [Ilumatobacter sp.]|uniref:HD domain-containing protein n=1 Tax=Ilumatobacter sp. TaxID=1967498 RepID=UPI003B51FDBD
MEIWVEHVCADTTLAQRLLGRHREKHRRYHTVEHVDAVVHDVLELAEVEEVEDVAVVVAAALYHDAVYEPRSSANERASARLARRDLVACGWSVERAERAAEMIEGTDRHLGPPDTGTAVLYDADLAVLSSEPVRYARYVDDVRAEYRHVGDGAWVTGRCEVLSGFLERERIYATDTAQRRWERDARSNLVAEIEGLRGTTGSGADTGSRSTGPASEGATD